MAKKKILVFGGGITGFSAARKLSTEGHDVTIHEGRDHVGGLASTWKTEDGFTFDNGPRFIFSTLAEKVGIHDQCFPVKYFEDLRIRKTNYKFPFGFARNPIFCASVGAAMATRFLKRKPRHLKDFLRIYYGRHFSQTVLLPLIEKWAGLPGEEISMDFAFRLLPTNLSYILYSLVKKLRGGVTEDYYQGGRFIVYPKNTIRSLFDHLENTPGVDVRKNSRLTGVVAEENRIDHVLINGNEEKADFYLNTTPISEFAKMTQGTSLLDPWKKLSYRGISVLFIKINKPKLLEHLWTWFPEKSYPFYRIAEFKNALPEMAPKNQTLISVEFAHGPESSLATFSAEEIYRMIQSHLKTLYGLQTEDILGFELKRSPHAYPVLKKSTETLQRSLSHQTPIQNLFIAGRIGMFQYKMMEGCFDSGVTCAKAILQAIEGKPFEVPSLEKDIPRDAYGRPLTYPE